MEMSGRALSRAGDIVGYAESVVADAKARNPRNQAKLFGFFYGSVADIRGHESNQFDVYIEPTDDHAHANLTTQAPIPKVDGEISVVFLRAVASVLRFAGRGSAEENDLLSHAMRPPG